MHHQRGNRAVPHPSPHHSTSPGTGAVCWTTSSFLKKPSPAVAVLEQPLRGPQRDLSAHSCRNLHRAQPQGEGRLNSKSRVGTIKCPSLNGGGADVPVWGWLWVLLKELVSGPWHQLEQGALCLQGKDGVEQQV